MILGVVLRHALLLEDEINVGAALGWATVLGTLSLWDL